MLELIYFSLKSKQPTCTASISDSKAFTTLEEDLKQICSFINVLQSDNKKLKNNYVSIQAALSQKEKTELMKLDPTKRQRQTVC